MMLKAGDPFLLWGNVLLLVLLLFSASKAEHISAVGDPGMRRDGLRVGFEAWNFCNEVGHEAPGMGSPRAADCFDVLSSHGSRRQDRSLPRSNLILCFAVSTLRVRHRVTADHNKLGVGKSFPGLTTIARNNPDLYAAEKELFLGSLCQVKDNPRPWHFWTIMLKNGNFDSGSGLCPRNGKKAPPFVSGSFPCFGIGCMNQPILHHQETSLQNGTTMRGGFSGTYDLDSLGAPPGRAEENSYFEVKWVKKVGLGSWEFHHKLKTSRKYPWLMLYLRADATSGFSGGYHYDTRGMLKSLPESPNFKVRLTLDIKQGGGPKSQFYLIDIGSCWKNDGSPCNGNTATDVTRYCEMIINPATASWCSPTSLQNCPLYHITSKGRKIHRNDTANFPYSAYHYYCAPGNAEHLDGPTSTCDPYSNPQAQELVQLLPHPIWADYGYPTKQGDGWIGDARTWDLDVGALSDRLYFYQDPGTAPARRIWTSIDVGTEVFVNNKDEVAEWTLTNFDVILT
ncbi:hypothetical protein SAY87_017530 [Trapa incisa]|uniref:DUF7705 domain-containing protein n=1 Tax=Trapa incisa TaxID=236973 RepID=A0AAN7KVZ1_9MYRT|nr:hypothetical protein SAY87_017530 [Trapa incisa]